MPAAAWLGPKGPRPSSPHPVRHQSTLTARHCAQTSCTGEGEGWSLGRCDDELIHHLVQSGGVERKSIICAGICQKGVTDTGFTYGTVFRSRCCLSSRGRDACFRRSAKASIATQLLGRALDTPLIAMSITIDLLVRRVCECDVDSRSLESPRAGPR